MLYLIKALCLNAVGKCWEKIKPRIDTDCTRIMKLEHEDITEAIIGSAYEVHNILGYGFLRKSLSENISGIITPLSFC